MFSSSMLFWGMVQTDILELLQNSAFSLSSLGPSVHSKNSPECLDTVLLVASKIFKSKYLGIYHNCSLQKVSFLHFIISHILSTDTS